MTVTAVLVQSLTVVPTMASSGPPAGGVLARSVKNDTSPPLRRLKGENVQTGQNGQQGQHSNLKLRRGGGTRSIGPATGGLIQSAPGTAVMPSTSANFDGIKNADNPTVMPPQPLVLPPDPEGDIGPNHYVQWVNLVFKVFDRTGTLLYGPAAGSTLWSGFGGLCQTTNQGDPIVRYDRLADRWMFSQFAFALDQNNNPKAPFHQCIAVSTTGDPTGSYNRYDFLMSTRYFNDYPKFGVWPDGYYMSVNSFDSQDPLYSFAGSSAVAFERAKMLNGQPARMVIYGPIGVNYGGMLPSDLDGSILPPAGSPDYFGAVDTFAPPGPPPLLSTFQTWKFHVDWVMPANSTFGSASNMPNSNLTTAPYNWAACNSAPNQGRNCIPQRGTSQGLDAVSDRLMNRLQYRRFADGHESLVANHTVFVGTSGIQAAVRWYEIRGLSTTPVLYQQGTYAPDTNSRWMGSAAMDQAGNIAIGYSVASSTTYPSIRYAGRLASDPLGTLPQAEATLIAGSGSQTSAANRWGDYSMMAVDPTDDCTFWYTQEYYSSISDSSWQTRVGSFKFPGCGIPAPPTGLVATAASSSVISLIWTGSTGATSYKVERSADGTNWAQAGTSNTASFSDSGLAAGTKYLYRVRASNGSGESAPSSMASATTFLTYTQSPQGNWVSSYGAGGYALFAWNGSSDLSALPQSNLVLDSGFRYVWSSGTLDFRALQSPDGATRQAATLYHSTQLRLHLTFNASYNGNLELYVLDWDSNARRETVTIDDGSGPRIAYITTAFDQGAWISLPISVASGASLSITVDRTAGANAVLSGLFLGGPGLAYTAAPQGNWVGTYGSKGYALFAWNGSTDLVSLPQSSLILDHGERYVWTGATTDVRALESPDTSSRRAACYFDGTQLTLRLTFTNAYAGTLHIYAIDWDSTVRRETVTITDALGSSVGYLTTSFNQGAWISVPINAAAAGSVTISVAPNGGANAVLSGLFLD